MNSFKWYRNIICTHEPYSDEDKKFFNEFSKNKFIHSIDEYIDLEKYYRSIKPNETECQFENKETTVSYLLRYNSDILGHMTYAEKVIDNLIKKYSVNFENSNILEVGAGLGDFACCAMKYFERKHMKINKYSICDISDSLIESQKVKCAKYLENIDFTNCRGEELNFENEKFDIIISNEVIADFYNIYYGENRRKTENQLMKRSIEIIKKYNIDCVGQYINTGAVMFLEEAYRVLKDGGIVFVSEYTEDDNVSRISNYMKDHKEVSINFELIKKVSRKIGFSVELVELTELLDIDPKLKILSEESFGILRKLMNLEKLLYSKEHINRLNENYSYKNISYMDVLNVSKFFKVLILCK